MAEEDVTLRASMTDEVSAALDRIEHRLGSVEDRLARVSAAGRVMGDGIDTGAGKATRALDKTAVAAEAASSKTKKAGDEAVKSGAKAAVASKGWEEFSNKVEKAGKKTGDFGLITSSVRWATIATGIYAVVGAISAAGAASAIGVAHLAPLLLNFLNLAPAALAAKAAMTAYKLAAKELAAPINQIKGEFTGLGQEIASGGLRTGIQNLANNLRPLAGVAGSGFREIGAQMGAAANNIASFVRQSSTLNSVRAIFAQLAQIVGHGLGAITNLMPAVLGLLQAVAPITNSMSQSVETLSGKLSVWLQYENATGNTTRWFTQAWDSLHHALQAAWNVMAGVFNILRDARNVTTGMGNSVLNLTERFREWTTSAQGQQRITQYFQDSLPAIRELGRLLGTVAGMLAHLAGGANIAPLLAMINSQLLPALGTLLGHLSAVGGLGPSLITVISNILRLLGGVQFSGLTMVAQALATISGWLVQLQQNVPGVNILISGLLLGFLGFKLVGPILIGISSAIKGVSAAITFFSTIPAILAAVSSGMETIAIVGLYVMDALSAAATAVGVAIDAAFIATPIGWIVLAVIAVIAIIVLLWTKCAWFRDAVKAIWNAIRIAAVAVWDAIRIAWDATINALVIAAKAVANFFVAIWHGIVDAAEAVWNALVVAWRAVWSVLSVILRIYWDIIKFVIQVYIYIIVGLFTLIAIAAKWVWDQISAGAIWLWNNVLWPVFSALGTAATAVWHAIVAAAQWCWGIISGAALWFWNNVLSPVFTAISVASQWVWSGLVNAAQWCWGIISGAASAVWNGFLHPIFSAIGAVGSAIWGGIVSAASWAWNGIKGIWATVAGWFAGIWNGITSAAGSAWRGLGDIVSGVGRVVKGVWDAIVGAAKAVWNFIARGWNSIPSFTVPDWIPGIGGHTFGLPKLPLLYAGGPTPGGPAIVGEHGPELLVRGDAIAGLLGARGPAITNLPRGGYVVPNLATIARGLAQPIPPSVATAIAAPPPPRAGTDRELLRVLNELRGAMAEQRPPIVVPPGERDTHGAVLTALRDHDRERRAAGRYAYTAGKS